MTVDSSDGTEFLPWVDVDQATGSVNVLYYTSQDDLSSGNEDVEMRLGTSLNGGAAWTLTNATSINSDEYEGGNDTQDSPFDYLEYIGLDVHQGTAHGLFTFEPFGGGADVYDSDAVYVSTTFANGANTLTIDGDDPGSSDIDTIEVRRASANSDYVEVFVNSARQFTTRAASIGTIQIDGNAGNDVITIAGDLGISVTVNGDSGTDSLVFNGTGSGESITVATSSITLGSTVVTTSNTESRTINGGGGADTISAVSSSSAVTILGDAGADSMTGSSAADSLVGGSENDAIAGGNGSDAIYGGDGNDSIYGDAGNDGLYGENNNDVLNGGSGTDYLSGGAGNDDFSAQDGEVDTLDGGSGWDTALVDDDVFIPLFDETNSIEAIFS